jgi:hypothetical protein
MGTIADFTDSELWLLRSTLRERYGEEVAIQLADTEMRLDPHVTQLHTCPSAYWQQDKCHFIVVKTADNRYRAQFFYRLYQMYGTGIEEFDDLSTCVVTLLQVQADHDMKERAEQEAKL